jgi:hypothetical protein
MAVAAIKPKNAVESLRDIVQDLLVPELKSIKIEIAAIRTEMRVEMDATRTEIRLRDEKQTEATRHLADNIKQLSDKLDYTLQIRERLASLEARLGRD